MSLGNLRPLTLLKPVYHDNLQDIDSMVKQGQGEGGQRVILVVWRCPDGCAQAAGTHVMGVGEVGHHEERAHLAARRSRVRKVVEATDGAAERRADIEHEWNIVRKQLK